MGYLGRMYDLLLDCKSDDLRLKFDAQCKIISDKGNIPEDDKKLIREELALLGLEFKELDPSILQIKLKIGGD